MTEVVSLLGGAWGIRPVAEAPVYAWVSRANMPSIRAEHTGCGTTNAALSFLGEKSYQTWGPETFHYNGTSWTTGGNNNNPRSRACSSGTTDAALVWGGYKAPGLGGPGDTQGYYNISELYNGTSWSAGGNLLKASASSAGCGTSDDALSFGGSGHPNFGEITPCTHYNGTSWSPGGDPITHTNAGAGCGTSTSALSFGGYGPRNETEHYNGTSWSAGGDLNYSHLSAAGCGATDAAFCFGEGEFTEHYDGASWSVGAALSPKQGAKGAGTTTSALSFGGYGGFANAPTRSTEEYVEGIR